MDNRIRSTGLPLRLAIEELVSEQFKQIAAFYKRDLLRVPVSEADVRAQEASISRNRRLLWIDLRERWRRDEVRVRGRLWGSRGSEWILGDFPDQREPDWDANQIESGGVVYVNVHVFEAARGKGFDLAKQDPFVWLSAYMASEVPRPKRDAALKDCMQRTGATWREAIQAWNRLDPKLRNPRGKPR